MNELTSDLSPELTPDMRAACESIYADFYGYWPSGSELRRIASALKPLQAESEALKEALRSLVEVTTDYTFVRIPQSDDHWNRFLEVREAARALVGSVPQTANEADE